MLTAQEAKTKTLEIIVKNAKNYITKTVEPKILEATRIGRFNCSVNHTHYAKALRIEVVKLLEEQGFRVKVADVFYDIFWGE